MYKFKFHSPKTIKDSVNIFNKSENPKYLAGGMTLLAAMKQKMSSPSDLIDLGDILDLKRIEKVSKDLIIGAMNTHNEIAKSEIVNKHLPGFSELALNIADNAVRNKGTIGGAICNADPAADYPAALLGLDAIIITNEREINSSDFFIDMFETSLKEEEIVIAVKLPIAKFTKYLKFASLASKYAIVGVFVVKNELVKFSVTGASNSPFIIKELENMEIRELEKINIDNLNFENYFINSDLHASSEYKISLIKTMLKKAINFIRDE